VDIKILDVETNHVGEFFPGTGKQLHKLLTKKADYEHFKNVSGFDDIYVKKGFDVDESAKAMKSKRYS